MRSSLRALPVLLALLAAPAAAQPPPPVGASAAILVDAVTGKVLWERSAHQRRPMASTTKIMTALLTLESGRLQEAAEVSEQAADTTQSSLWLRPHEHMSVRDLLTALLIKSANDAATALAEHLAGTEAAFVVRMNRRARQLGARDTHFMNPHGLHQPGHYSSAYDLALISRAALRYDLFRQIVATKSTTVSWEGKPWRRLVHNKNRLLTDFPGGDGVKTGFVKESGHCLVGSATRGGWQLLAVVLDSPDMWADGEGLLAWGFAQFEPLMLARAGEVAGRVRVRGGTEAWLPVRAGATLQEVVVRGTRPALRAAFRVEKAWAPYREGERVGRCLLLEGGRERRGVAIYAARQMGRAWWAALWHWGKWLLALLLAALGIRTYAKATKAAGKGRRRRQKGFRTPDPGGPGQG